MPASSSKMPVSTRKRVDDKRSDENDAKVVARDHKANSTKNDDMELSKSIASPNSENPKITGANPSSRYQSHAGKTKQKYNVELAVSASEPQTTDHTEEVHKLSTSSSTKESSKLAPICSSPPHTAASSRTHLFSPQPPLSKVSRS